MHENDGRSILSMLQKLGKKQIFSYVSLKFIGVRYQKHTWMKIRMFLNNKYSPSYLVCIVIS